MLSCRDITNKAGDYLEKELSFSARVNFRMHMFVCVNCRRYVNQLQTTIYTLGKMDPPDSTSVSGEQIKQVMELVKKHKNKGS